MAAPPLVWLVFAAFAAGAINAVAGGGSLISFPSLLATGLAAKAANVTNSVALWPGYVGGSLAYRAELATQRAVLARLLPACVAGALAGSWLLLATPEGVFRRVVPFLILVACALIAGQDYVVGAIRRRKAAYGLLRGAPSADEGAKGAEPTTVESPLGAPLRGDRPVAAVPGTSAQVAVLLLAVYGAYFGGALGIMLLAVLGVVLPDDLHRTNALKGMLSLVINAVALVYFALFGPVVWPIAGLMAAAALAGGYAGVGLARRIGRLWLRRFVVAYGITAAALLWMKG